MCTNSQGLDLGRFMEQPRRNNASVIALYAIAALLLANLVALLSRNDFPTLLPAAYGQARQGPIAGGAGLFVMPAQLAGNQWGCYLMDVDRGTLCVYQYQPGASQLKLVAARSFANDTRLANFNTTPSPQEILDLVNKQNQGTRGAGSSVPATNELPGKNN